ncbi:cytochrome c oxidase accessory protein CcoG [Sphingomonas echinoides]|uniref:Cytochrome c oxidase accessory protein CcoG n=2 Tax=Pseudomonadota TaxID=1224 RepID=A0ABU4PL47_9SPHN|nr:cytochrome c oxidase accessory protein CcoG [Sphingomonas echinoides]MDX5983817.1 cytochrome c oxidase accessory protein CcoG [Sphingomonas echinoides]
MAHPQDLTGDGQQFFEARRKVFPKAVDGPFRRLKWAIMLVALAIYYVTPWLRWNRGPYAPDQAVLVDLAHRRFYMFSIEIWPHEFYYVAGLLIMAGIGLFLVTSAVGRAWCGYACPQTVWTDLFVHVERAIDGDRNAQIKLQRAPWGPSKIARRIAKHSIWLVIGALTGGAWIFYFADAPTLGRAFVQGSAPFVAYATVGVLTATTYIFGGLMREQVCIYMCPWPRIQSAMLDEKSLTVTYKAWRGEPRSHGLKRAEPLAQVVLGTPSLVALIEQPELASRIGDCIDCNACVAVCPTGIDIREGSQIGCITCGLCIDACDGIMAKIGRPSRLIGYTTDLDARLAQAGEAPVPALKRLFRPRTLLYFGAWAGIGLAMLFALGNRERIGIGVLQTRNPQWVRLSDGSIRNGYTVKVRNMEERPRSVEIAISGVPGAVLWTEEAGRNQAARSVRVDVAPDQVAQVPLFVSAPGAGPTRADLAFTVRALDKEGGSARDTSFFERPEPTP